MPDQQQDILLEAIGRNAGVVLSLPSAGMLRHHKSRLLAGEEAGYWLESVADDGPLIESLIANGEPAGISFKKGPTKIVFASRVLRLDPAFRLNEDLSVAALFMEFPQQIKAIQRRTNYRVAFISREETSVRIWRIGPRIDLREIPTEAQEIQSKLCDISIGGIGVEMTGIDGNAPLISCDDRLRIELRHRDDSLLLEGRMRFSSTPGPDRILRAGVQFRALEMSLEGRQNLAMLTKILGDLQREEVRRYRLGILRKPA